MHVTAEAIELRIVPAERQDHERSPLADFAEVIAIAVDRQDMTLRIAGMRHHGLSPLNNDQEDEALGVRRPRLDRLHARCNYHEEQRRRKRRENRCWS